MVIPLNENRHPQPVEATSLKKRLALFELIFDSIYTGVMVTDAETLRAAANSFPVLITGESGTVYLDEIGDMPLEMQRNAEIGLLRSHHSVFSA